MPFKIFIITALIIVVLSMLAMLIRVILGPSLADRVVALDAIGLQLMAVIALFSILLNIKYMLVVILMVGILAFLELQSFLNLWMKVRLSSMIATIVTSVSIIFVVLEL